MKNVIFFIMIEYIYVCVFVCALPSMLFSFTKSFILVALNKYIYIYSLLVLSAFFQSITSDLMPLIAIFLSINTHPYQ